MQRASPPPLLPLLRSRLQAEVLTLVLLNPQEEWSLTGVASRTGASVSSVQREVTRAEQAGVVGSRRLGNVRLVKATDSPLTASLTELLLRSFGPRQVLVAEGFTWPLTDESDDVGTTRNARLSDEPDATGKGLEKEAASKPRGPVKFLPRLRVAVRGLAGRQVDVHPFTRPVEREPQGPSAAHLIPAAGQALRPLCQQAEDRRLSAVQDRRSRAHPGQVV
jgi:hypothetical protein